MMQNAHAAYAKTTTSLRSGSGIEYDAFSNVTRRLKTNGAEGSSPSFPKLAEAIHDNRKLWILLASNVAEEENQLPEMLRAQIFYLGEFVDQHSRKILSGEASEAILIEINLAVMRGLQKQEHAA